MLYVYLGLGFSVLSVGYNINPTYIIVASIDRTLITSANARTRQRSTRRLAITTVTILTLFWMLFHIHAFIFIEIIQLGPNYFVCYYQPGTYTIFLAVCSILLDGALPPVLMIIFGLWTVKNIRQRGRTKQLGCSSTTENIRIGVTHALQSKDHQLIRMVLMDVIVYIICKCPVTITLLYQQITQYNEKTEEQQLIEQAILQLTYFVFFIDNCISCYLNMIISKIFRAELKRIILNIRLCCR
ncbi:unnamed protein product [Rotaria magnacalcarata]|nr:unnamed protein product [Rotaria magnacalcarata]CAF4101262.1 unnamed protein product [Rotaria magnacalcarata]